MFLELLEVDITDLLDKYNQFLYDGQTCSREGYVSKKKKAARERLLEIVIRC